MYKRHEFQTLHAKSMWREVNVHVFFSLIYCIFQKIIQKFDFCIDANSRALPHKPTAVSRTPVMTSHFTYKLSWSDAVVSCIHMYRVGQIKRPPKLFKLTKY